MKNFKKWFLILGMCIFVLVSFSNAKAVTYYFNWSNAFGEWSGAVPPGYGSVEITKEADGFIYFTVDANDAFFQPSADPEEPGLTWDKFYFNTVVSKTEEEWKSIIEVDEGVGDWTVQFDQNVSMFGLFDLGETGSSIGNNAVDPFNFHIEDASLEVTDFILTNDDGYLFAGHLRRFNAMEDIYGENVDSNFLAVGDHSVPEPGTLLLLGLGLALLGFAGRKKLKKS